MIEEETMMDDMAMEMSADGAVTNSQKISSPVAPDLGDFSETNTQVV